MVFSGVFLFFTLMVSTSHMLCHSLELKSTPTPVSQCSCLHVLYMLQLIDFDKQTNKLLLVLGRFEKMRNVKFT